MPKQKYPKSITLAEVLSECADETSSVHTSYCRAERAAWFRKLLNNAIANERHSLDFLARNPRLLEEEPTRDQVHYKCISRCEAALAVLSGTAGPIPTQGA